MLQQIFDRLTSKTSNNQYLCQTLWKELAFAYGQSPRHYHNLSHLENLIQELETCKILLHDYDVVLYSVFYHDIVYNVLKQDNEEQSAAIAMKNLEMLQVSKDKQERCAKLILATKSHAIHNDADINLFTDADLSILGKPERVYRDYCTQVRQEYIAYPDSLYIPGRTKVLQHFQAMPRIYKTDFFYRQYEDEARKNIAHELNLLQ